LILKKTFDFKLFILLDNIVSVYLWIKNIL